MRSLAYVAMSASLLLLGCRGMLRPARPFWPPLPEGYFSTAGSHLQITGTGRPEDPAGSRRLTRAESRDAALMEAWDLLREYIESLPVLGRGTIGQMAEADPELAKTIETLVRSAKRVSTHYDGDQAAVVIRIDLHRINKALGTEFRQAPTPE